MSIDNYCGRDNQQQPLSRAEAHSQLALEQSARYAANLAIARWINNSSANPALHTAPTAPAPARAAWYAQAQQNFQAWLAAGGFAQYDCAELDDPAGATSAAVEIAPLAGAANLPA